MVWDIEAISNEIRKKINNKEKVALSDKEYGDIRSVLAIIGPHLENLYTYKGVLGIGGSGIVLELVDISLGCPRALKFPRPISNRSYKHLQELVKEEIGHLVDLNHPNIVNIINAKNLRDSYPYAIYIMMEKVGCEEISRPILHLTSATQFYRMVVDVSNVLCHLHSSKSNVVHLDIKPDNIKIDKYGRAVMIDMGTCKRRGESQENINIYVTEKFADPDLLKIIKASQTKQKGNRRRAPKDDSNRIKGVLKRKQLQKQWDLTSFGLTLLDWLGVTLGPRRSAAPTTASNAFCRSLSDYERKYYVLVAARLLAHCGLIGLYKSLGLNEDIVKSIRIETAEELNDVLKRLKDDSNPLLGIKEISDKSCGSLYIGPGMYVPRTNALLSIIEHRYFKRLNTISKLGFMSQVYRSVKHSRREHSLGKYYYTIKIIESMYYDPFSPLFKQIITEQNLRCLIMAALIDDIGQYPLAFHFEDIPETEEVFNHRENSVNIIKRDIVSNQYILSKTFEDWRITDDQEKKDIVKQIVELISENQVKLKEKIPYLTILLKSIIRWPASAQLIESLQRDAKQANIRYADCIDVDNIIRFLTVILKDTGRVNVEHLSMGIHAKGRVAAEMMIFARYAMYSQVYWHHAVRCQDALLTRAVVALLESKNENARKAFKAKFLKYVNSIPDILYSNRSSGANGEVTYVASGLCPTDVAVLKLIKESMKGMKEASLIDYIEERNLYDRLWLCNTESHGQRKWKEIVGLWDQTTLSNMHVINEKLEREVLQHLRKCKQHKLVRQIKELNQPWLVIDILRRRRSRYLNATNLHYVLEGERRRNESTFNVTGEQRECEVWKNYGEPIRDKAGTIRVYGHPNVVDSIRQVISNKDGIKILIETIKAAIKVKSQSARKATPGKAQKTQPVSRSRLSSNGD
ncbi:hypothetical protein JW859_07010 [bacterium]|nr:hypothetical protein [bacterium]